MAQLSSSMPQYQPLRVSQLVPAEQEVVTVEADVPTKNALAVMARGGFDQVPVTIDRTVIGVFSYRSLAQNLHAVRRQDDPLSYPVREFLEDVPFVRAGSQVEEALRELDEHGAVLIGDEDRLLALVTPSDLNTFLWNSSKQFMLLRDIELATRYLFTRACSDEDECRSLVAEARPPDENGAYVERLEDLTFGELISVINGAERFGRVFSRTFGRSREIVISMLEPVREVRNKVFHFRSEVSPDELGEVAVARAWLQRRVRMLP